MTWRPHARSGSLPPEGALSGFGRPRAAEALLRRLVVIPSFSLGAAPDVAWRSVVLALGVFATVCGGAWLPALALPESIGLALLFAGLIAAALTLLRSPALPLHWDGRRFDVGGAQGALDVALDLGGWMLLRWRPAESKRPWAARWLPLSAAAAGPAAWHALRCALHSPAPNDV